MEAPPFAGAGGGFGPPPIPGASPIVRAVQSGDVAALKELLAAGGDTDAATQDGDTGLAWACNNGNAGAVAALLQAGADASIADHDGDTPLFDAAAAGALPAFALVVAHQATMEGVETRNRDGKTPLDVRGCADLHPPRLCVCSSFGLCLTHACAVRWQVLDSSQVLGEWQVVAELCARHGAAAFSALTASAAVMAGGSAFDETLSCSAADVGALLAALDASAA